MFLLFQATIFLSIAFLGDFSLGFDYLQQANVLFIEKVFHSWKHQLVSVYFWPFGKSIDTIHDILIHTRKQVLFHPGKIIRLCFSRIVSLSVPGRCECFFFVSTFFARSRYAIFTKFPYLFFDEFKQSETMAVVFVIQVYVHFWCCFAKQTPNYSEYMQNDLKQKQWNMMHCTTTHIPACWHGLWTMNDGDAMKHIKPTQKCNFNRNKNTKSIQIQTLMHIRLKATATVSSFDHLKQ